MPQDRCGARAHIGWPPPSCHMFANWLVTDSINLKPSTLMGLSTGAVMGRGPDPGSAAEPG